MKSVHVPFGFYPDPVGGTEVYVAALATALTRQGHPAIIAAPALEDADYLYQGLPVHRFAAPDRVSDVSELYGAADPEAGRRFARILDREQPDVFHMHAFTRACSVGLVREAKARNIPVVFTYHTPTVSCQRGTLLEFGAEPCDGRVEVSRCAGCTLDGLGVSSAASRVLGQMPISVGNMLEAAGLRGGGWTALRMSSLIDQRHQALVQLFTLVDRVVALTPWVRDLLKRNDVPDSKIAVSPHGIRVSAGRPPRTARPRSGRVRVAHLGRLDPVKGTGLLIRALRLIPDAPIDLDIFGIVQGSGDIEASGNCNGWQKATRVSRSMMPSSIQRSSIASPATIWSRCRRSGSNTGPLVVLEAFAAGVPVLGSALGGLLDKVTDGVDGLHVARTTPSRRGRLLCVARSPRTASWPACARA